MEYLITLGKILFIGFVFFCLGACSSVPSRDCTSICFDHKAFTEEKSYCGCDVNPAKKAKFDHNFIMTAKSQEQAEIDRIYYMTHPQYLKIYNEEMKGAKFYEIK